MRLGRKAYQLLKHLIVNNILSNQAYLIKLILAELNYKKVASQKVALEKLSRELQKQYREIQVDLRRSIFLTLIRKKIKCSNILNRSD